MFFFPLIFSQMEYILNNTAAVPSPGEERVAALTAWERAKWAHIRETVFRQGKYSQVKENNLFYRLKNVVRTESCLLAYHRKCCFRAFT